MIIEQCHLGAQIHELLRRSADLRSLLVEKDMKTESCMWAFRVFELRFQKYV